MVQGNCWVWLFIAILVTVQNKIGRVQFIRERSLASLQPHKSTDPSAQSKIQRLPSCLIDPLLSLRVGMARSGQWAHRETLPRASNPPKNWKDLPPSTRMWAPSIWPLLAVAINGRTPSKLFPNFGERGIIWNSSFWDHIGKLWW